MAEDNQVAESIKTTTCYMCACRCGIKVHLKDGKVRYIEGNEDHPVNRGVICAKGSAGIQHHYAKSRLSSPLLRVGPRGKGEFKEISWEEALSIAEEKLRQVREDDPKKLAFFTGRDQSQSLTGWWASQFGTPNYAAHGGFCSVNMAAGGLYSIGGSFWEFGEPDWEQTKYLLLIGVAEDHDSNPIKIGLGQVKSREGTKVVSVNPVRTGYSAIADEWLGIKPGTDGLFIGSLIRELLVSENVDWDFLAHHTNSACLVVKEGSGQGKGLFARDAVGAPLIYDCKGEKIVPLGSKGAKPALFGDYILEDGRDVVPAFYFIAEEFLRDEYKPEEVAPRTGIAAETIRRIAAELADTAFNQEIVLEKSWVDADGVRHDKTIGRPVSIHAMRGISAHSNGFDTCRMIHLLQMLLGAIDCPGAFRYKPPFPKAIPPAKKPARQRPAPGQALETEPLGFPSGPEDLAVDEKGNPLRLDKAFSWEHPLALHGLMHMALHNAWAGDPYPVDVLFLYMANMAWNSSMNVEKAIHYLTDKDSETGDYKIPFFIYSDAFYSETVAYADLVLPDTTYLERWDCISMLDRPIGSAHAAADAIRQPVLSPDRDVRAFQDVLLDLGARLALPGMVTDDKKSRYPGGYSDYMVNHERMEGCGPLAGWRGDKGAPNPEQLTAYIDNGCFWEKEIPEEAQYYRFANANYLSFAHDMGWVGSTEKIYLNVYSEVLQKFHLAGCGEGEHLPPEECRTSLKEAFSPVPHYRMPLEHEERDAKQYPLAAITQRPMHMYHSWGGHNKWLRQITGRNYLYVATITAEELGLEDDDWVWAESPYGRVKCQIKTMSGVNPNTVWTWNAIGKRRGAWALKGDIAEAKEGFLLNHVLSEFVRTAKGEEVLNSDPVTGQAAWYDAKIRIFKAEGEYTRSSPAFPALASPLNGASRESENGKRASRKNFRQVTDGLKGKIVDYVAWQVSGRDKS